MVQEFSLIGQERASGGNCLVSWDFCNWPLKYGGLNIHNLEILGWSLHIRWLEKTNYSRP
jgi:hypothetical protein